jgi:hypothetical protein
MYFVTDKYGRANAVLNSVENHVLKKLDKEYPKLYRKDKHTVAYGEVIEHETLNLYAIEIMQEEWIGDLKPLVNLQPEERYVIRLSGDWTEPMPEPEEIIE